MPTKNQEERVKRVLVGNAHPTAQGRATHRSPPSSSQYRDLVFSTETQRVSSHRQSTGELDSDRTGLEPAGDGRMWLDRRFRSQLQQAGLTEFDDVMATSTGRCLRALGDRENWHLRLHAAHHKPRGIYLKKHHVRTWQSRLRARLGIGPGKSAGRVEAENVGGLTAHGIDVMKLVAFGEKLHADGLLESFVLTEELEEYVELHEFLRRRFARRQSERAVPREGDFQRLIRRVAEIVRRFHAAGYNHRDLYCCHFFIKEPRRGEFDVRLIDLQRVQRRRFRRRWLVKDLAQLSWSAPRDRIGCSQRLAFMRIYLGVKKLRPADKRLIREVMAKQQLMERKLGEPQ